MAILPARSGRPALIALLILSWLFGQRVWASAGDWYLLENRHFRMLSNAPADRTRTLLADLELYREAVTRIVNVRVRDGAPPTPIIVFKDRRGFEKYAGFGVAGYVVNKRRHGVIVMPSDIQFLSEAHVVRHEYVHILALYMPLRYPRWYNEGIAEVLSLAVVEPEEGIMTFGLANARQRHVARGLDAFDERLFDGTSRVRIRTDPYWYFWLVTHYLMLGRPDLTPNLERYLVARGIGESHASAFERAFGKSLTKMWEADIVPYTKAFPTFRVKIDFSAADLDFKTRPAPPEAVGAAFNMLQENRISRKRSF
jgi:hypothetical protein